MDGASACLSRLRLALPFTPLLKAPEDRSVQVSELVFGQDFDLHLRQGNWAYGRVRALLPGSERTDYVGWVDAKGLQPREGEPGHAVSVLSAPVFSRPDLKSHIVMSLPLGARLSVAGEDGGYLQIGAGAYVNRRHARWLSDVDTDPVAIAQLYLGQPYVWGGNGSRGVDCSGLTQMALTACGVDCPRDADHQEAALGEAVPIDVIMNGQGRRGDLLFWPGHVGFLSAPDRLLHANAHHMSVVDEALQPAIARMASKDVPLRAARRL